MQACPGRVPCAHNDPLQAYLTQFYSRQPLNHTAWLRRPGEKNAHQRGNSAVPAATRQGAVAQSAAAVAHGTDRDDAQTEIVQAEVPLIAEASLQVGLGEGVHLIPGLVILRQQGRTCTALAARMQWFF